MHNDFVLTSTVSLRTGVAVLIVSAAAASGCGQAAAENGAAASAQEGGRVINVEVMSAPSGAFTEVVNVVGTVMANRDVVVSAEEAGVIRRVHAEKGSRVRAGDTLASVDDRILAAQVAQARAHADFAEQVWERRRRLYEQEKIGTEIEYLEARSNAEQSRANHALLAERLARTVIRAPISGVLESRDVDVGNMVGPGSRVARIIQLDTLKIAGGVPERYALDITRGTPVSVTFDVLPGRAFSGRVSYSGATVNPRNRTYAIEISLPNAGLLVKPEMVANIEAVRRTVSATVSLPQEALVRVEQGFVVFVVEADDSGVERAVARFVTTGSAQRNQIAILNGVSEGDRVVIAGQNQLAAGDRVRIVNAPAMSPADAAGGEAR